MIVVFDASTLVGAALHSDGIPRRAIVEATRGHQVALSKAAFGEISEVLKRPKFRRSISLTTVDEILGLLTMAACWFEPSERVRDCRDPGDDIYLELALAAGAEVIVSSDRDLLSMEPWRDTGIITARAFLERIDSPA